MSLAAFPYSLFSTKFKKTRIRYAEPGEAVLELYRTRISEEFALFMQEEGFCTYLNGLFTTVNPLARKTGRSVLPGSGNFRKSAAAGGMSLWAPADSGDESGSDGSTVYSFPRIH